MSEISALLEGITIEDILDRQGFEYRVTHGSSGEQLNVEECPVCGGSEWKVYFNRDSGLGNCFHGSCQTTFNVFTFAKAAISADSARPVAQFLEKVAAEIGWRPARKKKRIELEQDDNTEWKMPDSYALPTKDGQNLQYLEDRRIDGDTAAMFGLRYCHRGWFNYTKPDGTQGGQKYDERVLIPVHDLDATLVTFQGRDLTDKAEKKYLFPSGLPGTGVFLYNAHRSLGREHAILNEGAFDVIRTFLNTRGTKYDDSAVMGTFGLKLSHGRDSGDDQLGALLKLKRRGLKEVTVMLDGEPKAFEAALEIGKQCARLGLKTSVALLPATMDPGEANQADTLKALDERIAFQPKDILRLRMRNPYKIAA